MAEIENKDLSEKILLEFEAYDRPHKVWSKEFYSSVIVIAFLVSIIFYFIEGFMPVLVIWALVFMLWAMAKTEPRLIKTELTSWGLKSQEKTYRFEEMASFWFETKWGTRLMRINLAVVPWHLVVVLDPNKEDDLKKHMLERVIFQEPAVTWVDRALKWVGEKMPLE
ncbi:hypothetical protein A3K29_00865 [Candidatus Collierbacteria bacterium RIFOXYB2_FULL_46_14]|uniref:Uncharacterized protein n=1 Tax=Candidatus Collierbacteria bacterium GW2011_GWA2_46_26 TaxID=1618381 RepID=A0A0G1PKL0_9BACT|nr:MAG: hypothetical protein UW29_C0003G0008 [Candidatus Collierbacteria bacterium GW2011_GWC2_44_13]KKU33266.1 MAG: hypothetical protein UX47_C0005G0068 [Candidatus Collierbacteria bacterium GW2011_GWA2_46_26]OGD72688.1 MAG: hypothetical protein A3K29_00865 [Candidatus Collierbacteria bacterium RIFOXYB2_FULL_46_14]OGD75730.1 MAG: hypothetical protein A3K43_00865 [Candidatus Collierbacteria bacterium RIFOXYA2_FULL_46_20]OGD77066.1 MAG: hypothetical protein A3K39_00865 [Candidatus Collierbacteri